ncbi:MAG: hypothetical protein GY772_29190, partial [bacterium]|nr:hypothetical protein [bacterium]
MVRRNQAGQSDICTDAAALSMDLTWRGRADLAESLLSVYADRSNDFNLFPLIDFYEALYAYLLGVLHAQLATHAPSSPSSRVSSEEKARRYFLLALAARRRPLLPPIVV